jgi:DNA polymerase III epsilon subunit-like protein
MADDLKALVFDTETTGLFKFYHAAHVKPEQMRPYPWVIEFFGHVVTDDGSVLAEEDFLVRPNPLSLIDETIIRITGITPDMVKDEQMFEAYADRVLALLAEAEAIVAHNLSYDMRIMEVAYKRLGRYTDWVEAVKGKRLICTVQESEHYKGHRMKLTDLHTFLMGAPFEGAHRARQDVAGLTACYLEMRKRGDI